MPCKSVRLEFFRLLLHLVLHTAFSKLWNATQHKIHRTHKIFTIPKGLENYKNLLAKACCSEPKHRPILELFCLLIDPMPIGSEVGT